VNNEIIGLADIRSEYDDRSIGRWSWDDG